MNIRMFFFGGTACGQRRFSKIAVLLLISSFDFAFAQTTHRPAQVESKKLGVAQTDLKQGAQLVGASMSSPSASIGTTSGRGSSESEAESLFDFFGFKVKIADFFLVLFTLVQSFFTGLLWYSTEKLWKETKSTSKISEQTAVAAKESADTAKAQIELAREEFVAIHRPKIVVRLFLPHIDVTVQDLSYPIKFVCANAGETAAEIKEIGTAIFVGAGSNERVGIELQFHIEPTKKTLNPSDYIVFVTKDKFPFFDRVKTNQDDWFCVGFIKYSSVGDDVIRATGFCRKWDNTASRWVRESDDDYEYCY